MIRYEQRKGEDNPGRRGSDRVATRRLSGPREAAIPPRNGADHLLVGQLQKIGPPAGTSCQSRFGPSTSSAGSDQVPSTGERTVEALIRDLRQLMISSRAIWMSRTLLRRCNPLENVYLKSSERPIGAIDHRSTMRKSRRSRPLRKLSGVFEVNGRLTLRIREPTVDWEVNAARMAPSLLRSQRAVPIYNATTVAEIPLGLILLSLIHPRPVNHRSEFRG